MRVSYDKLWKLLIDNKMKKGEFYFNNTKGFIDENEFETNQSTIPF